MQSVNFKGIKEIRNRKGITLIDLSNKTRLSYGYIADLEKGAKNNPSTNTLILIANALQVPITELISTT